MEMSRVWVVRKSCALAVFVALLVTASCRSTSTTSGIRETTDTDGFPVRLEVHEETGGDVPPSAIAERLRRHVGQTMSSPRPAAQPSATAITTATAFDPFVERDCPPEGSASNEKKAQSNRLKNRTRIPEASDIDSDISLAALRMPGNDVERWSTGLAGTIEGVVRKAKGTGKESCNCRAGSRRLTDTHLDIVASTDDQERPVIAEITPVMRLIHEHFNLEDWSSQAIKDRFEGRRVRITGWLFFDEDHLTGADNTDPHDTKGEDNWRATCWEIHPITSIELLD